MVVAQLAEWLLMIPEDPGSNPVIGNFYLNIYLLLTVCRKDENKEKRGREWPIFLKKLSFCLASQWLLLTEELHSLWIRFQEREITFCSLDKRWLSKNLFQLSKFWLVQWPLPTYECIPSSYLCVHAIYLPMSAYHLPTYVYIPSAYLCVHAIYLPMMSYHPHSYACMPSTYKCFCLFVCLFRCRYQATLFDFNIPFKVRT